MTFLLGGDDIAFLLYLELTMFKIIDPCTYIYSSHHVKLKRKRLGSCLPQPIIFNFHIYQVV